jgi:hypothetical protein
MLLKTWMILSFSSTTVTIVRGGLIWYRKLVRDNMYVIDYSDDGGVTWELNIVQLELDEDTIIMEIDHGVPGCRQVVRDGVLCIDEELTPTGFDGIEDMDWDNIYNTKPVL